MISIHFVTRKHYQLESKTLFQRVAGILSYPWTRKYTHVYVVVSSADGQQRYYAIGNKGREAGPLKSSTINLSMVDIIILPNPTIKCRPDEYDTKREELEHKLIEDIYNDLTYFQPVWLSDIYSLFRKNIDNCVSFAAKVVDTYIPLTEDSSISFIDREDSSTLSSKTRQSKEGSQGFVGKSNLKVPHKLYEHCLHYGMSGQHDEKFEDPEIYFPDGLPAARHGNTN